MKLGISTYAYAWSIGTVTGCPPRKPLRLSGFLRRCAEKGVSLVQIADNLPLHPLSEEELRVWMRAEMPRFMQPQHVRFVDALPQTPTYKVEKYKLRGRILSELGRC